MFFYVFYFFMFFYVFYFRDFLVDKTSTYKCDALLGATLQICRQRSAIFICTVTSVSTQ